MSFKDSYEQGDVYLEWRFGYYIPTINKHMILERFKPFFAVYHIEKVNVKTMIVNGDKVDTFYKIRFKYNENDIAALHSKVIHEMVMDLSRIDESGRSISSNVKAFKNYYDNYLSTEEKIDIRDRIENRVGKILSEKVRVMADVFGQSILDKGLFLDIEEKSI